MGHTLEQTAIDDSYIEFTCSTCSRKVNFMKEGFGDPHVTQIADNVFSPPDNPDQWMSPCLQA